jgi:ADP-heptose:LPS heptosyltransferase
MSAEEYPVGLQYRPGLPEPKAGRILFYSMLVKDKFFDDERVEIGNMANENILHMNLNPTITRDVITKVKKIAVLRANGIGDFVFSLPALDALRHTYPSAEIVLLGLPWHTDFLKDRPGPIDRVEVVPQTRGVGIQPNEIAEEDPGEIERFFERMSQEGFDLAVQIHGGGRHSNPFIKHLGARVTVGSCTEDAEVLDRWIPFSYYHNEILRFIEVVGLTGALPVSLEPRIEITRQDLEEAASLLPKNAGPLAVLNPGAGDPRRRWAVEKFAMVGNALAWEGATVVITGSAADRGLAEAVSSRMSAPNLNLSGEMSLNGLAGLLSQASVVVSNDSGPLHLARAVGAATVGIYWCGNMINAGPVTLMRHRTAISWRLECPVCGLNLTRSSCDHHTSIVDEITEVEVKTLALELLERHKKRVTVLSQKDGGNTIH